MEFVPYDPTTALVPQGSVPLPQSNARGGEVLQSAFRQENDLVNLAMLNLRPSFERDNEFNIIEALADDPLADQYADQLGRAQSQAELDFIRGRVEQELADKRVLAGAGFGGFVAASLAGLVSPASLIPVAGQARGLKGVRDAFLLAGAGVTAQEATLYGLQETRTVQESVTGIAFGTVLGGLLGSASRYIEPRARVDLETRMANKRGEMTISYADPSTGVSRQLDFDTIDVQPVTRPAQGLDVEDVSRKMEAYVPPPSAPNSPKNVSAAADWKSSFEAVPETRLSKHSIATVYPEKGISEAQKLADILDGKKNPDGNLDRVLRDSQHPSEPTNFTMVSFPNSTISEHAQKNVIVSREGEVALKDLREAYPDVNFMTRQEAVDWMNAGAPVRNVDEVSEALTISNASIRDRSTGAKEAAAGQRNIASKGPLSRKAIEVLSKINPVTRLLNNPVSSSAAVWMERIQLPGIKLEGAAQFDSAAGEGTVFARTQVHQRILGETVQKLDDAYARHYHNGKQPEGKLQSAWLETIKSKTVGVPEGKLTFDEFSEAAFDVANTGVKHPDRYVNEAAEAQLSYYKYVDGMAERYYADRVELDGDDAKPLYVRQEFGEDSDVQNYVHHIFDNVLVVDQMDDFLADLTKHGEAMMDASFVRAHQSYVKAREKLWAEEAVYSADTKDLTKDIKATEQAIAKFEVDFKADLDRIDEVRKSFREAGYEGKDLAAEMKAFRESLGTDYVDAAKTYRDNQRQLKVLQDAKKKRPADRKKVAEEIEQKLFDLEDSFDDYWRGKGAEDLNIDEGRASFNQQAKDDATNLFRRITGQSNRVAGMDVLVDKRGPELQRTLNLPYEVKRKYLVKNPEQVVRAHGHSMFPDIELYRATGNANGAKIFADIESDINTSIQRLSNATHTLDGHPVVRVEPLDGEKLSPAKILGRLTGKAKDVAVEYRDVLTGEVRKPAGNLVPITDELRTKLNRQMRKDADGVLRDMRGVIDRLRHQRGIPKNGDGFGYRVGRAALSANVFRYMGGVAISSIPDVARPVMKYGLTKVFKNAWAPLVTDLKLVKASREEAYRAGIGFDPQLHNRAAAIFDVSDNHSLRQTMAERGLEFLANKTGFVGLFDRWTAEMKFMATQASFAEFSDAILKNAAGKASPNQKAMLNAAGLGEDMQKRIAAQYDIPGGSTEFDNGFRLPNTEDWDDFDAVMAYRAAISSVVDDLIVTPGLDRPLWMDENQAFRMVAQFRSFSFTATNRIIMSGLQEQDMAFMQGATMSLALGAISYYAWARSVGGDTWERAKNADEELVIYEAFQRSGLLGVLSEGQRIGEQIPGLNDWAVFGGEGRSSRRAESILGAALGPSYDLASKLTSIAQGLSDPTQQTLHTARTAVVPYQNVFYFRTLLDKMESSLADALDIPEDRR